MQTSIQLADRFRGSVIGPNTIANTSFKDQLSQVNLSQALQKVGSLNTIAALTFHVNYYIEGVVHLFEKGSLDIRDKYSYDLPELKSEQAWENMKDALYGNTEKFANDVEKMTEEDLNAVFVEERYGNYRKNINGLIEHNYYHLGQITLIRKLLAEQI